MGRFLLKRLLQTVIILIIISIMAFALIHIIPGDPVYAMLGTDISPDYHDQVYHSMGLDLPLVQQYFRWTGNFLKGQMGYSYHFKEDVSSLVARRLPPTLILGIASAVFSVILGLLFGIITAVRRGKPILIVRLEDVPVREEWKDLLAGREEIPLLDTPEARAAAIMQSGFLPRRLRRSWRERIPWRGLGLAVSMAFFLAAAAALGALTTGRWAPVPEQPAPETPAPTAAPTPVPTVELGEAERYFAVSFPDRQQERAIRRVLGIPADAIFRWQIAEIPELYFCGNMTVDAKAAVSFGADGTCRVNGAPVIQGQVSDLRLIGSMVKLERLALICQPLDDLSGLRGHLLLRELSLAGSRVDDLTALTELPSLETLRLEHTDVRDLTPLEGLPALKRVTVSRDMLPLLWSDSAPFAGELARDE